MDEALNRRLGELALRAAHTRRTCYSRFLEPSALVDARAAAAKETNPVILMGDLNMEPDDPILAPLFDALADSADRRDGVKTFPSGTPDIKIDYILHSAGIRGLSVRSMDTQNSDHRPLVARLERA